MRQGIVRRVADLALKIEPDRTRVLEWILHSRLSELGGLTTFELACNGEGERVLALLDQHLHQHADAAPRLPSASH